jgi:hypothetical protein
MNTHFRLSSAVTPIVQAPRAGGDGDVKDLFRDNKSIALENSQRDEVPELYRNWLEPFMKLVAVADRAGYC